MGTQPFRLGNRLEPISHFREPLHAEIFCLASHRQDQIVSRKDSRTAVSGARTRKPHRLCMRIYRSHGVYNNADAVSVFFSRKNICQRNLVGGMLGNPNNFMKSWIVFKIFVFRDQGNLWFRRRYGQRPGKVERGADSGKASADNNNARSRNGR